MVTGKYRVYKNGELAVDESNVVTEFGKDAIVRYLCGAISDWAGSMAVGSGSTAATTSDSRLKFEFSRNAVNLKAPSFTMAASVTQAALTSNVVTLYTTDIHGFAVGQSITVSDVGSPFDGTYTVTSVPTSDSLTYNKTNANVTLDDIEPQGSISSDLRSITMQTTLDSSLAGTIYEVGLYGNQGIAAEGNFDGRVISFFEEGNNASGESDPLKWSYASGVTQDTTNSRVGSANVYVPAGTTVSLGGSSSPGSLVIDMTGYQLNDIIQIAHYLSTTSTGSITIQLFDSQGYSISKTFTYSNANGYQISGDAIKNWTFSNSNFNYIVSRIVVTTSGLATSMDAIRVDDTDTIDTGNGLVSRAVFNTPVTKVSGDVIDIEYVLTLDL